MTPDARAAAWVALCRFGLGPRPGELDAVARNPRGWLNAQLGRRPALLGPGLLSATSLNRLCLEAGRTQGPRRAQLEAQFAAAWDAEARARLRHATTTDTPFLERLVAFWSNHFCVSALKPSVRGLAGAFEREAIRPHVLGRFEDMLLAVVRHPAMLEYLDNAVSYGPRSPYGRQTGLGLNENLAREILELHTLGVEGGYTLDDVQALAAMLTGWTIDRTPDARTEGAFLFEGAFHEPGVKRFLGRTYGEAGAQEAERALAALAAHPSTARFLALKLARHFVSDSPDAAATAPIARAFAGSRGNLAVVARSLIGLAPAWERPGDKLRAPWDLVVATHRALGPGAAPTAEATLEALRQLGQPLWGVPSPAGWRDRVEDWLGPEATLRRVDWARTAAAAPRAPDPRALYRATVEPLANADLLFEIERAPPVEARTLLFASPTFQRR